MLRFLLDDTDGAARVASVQLDADGMTGLVVLDIGGTRAVVESGSTGFHGWDEHTQVYFQKGWLRTQAPPLMQKETPATVEVYRAEQSGQPAQRTEEYAPPSWSYREEARHFLAGLQTGEPFRSSAADTLQDVRLFEDIYRIVAEGRNR